MSYTWTETYPPADYDFLWKFISVSDDGSVVLCPQWFDDVYVSEDSGSTWRHAKPNPDVVGYLWDDKNYSWWCGGVSGDGQHMVLGSQDSFDDKDGDPVPQLYLSHDRGVTWTAAYPLADCTGQAWYCACLDYDGSHLLVSDGSQAWVSVDSGASWTEALPGGASAAGVSCAIANDGATMYLAAARLWRSADSGSTWTELRPAGDQDTDFEFTACTAAGSKVFVGEYGGRLWLSTDSGTTWTEMKPDGSANKYWACGGMSRDGSVLWASHSTKTFISEDGGTTWRDATAEYPSTEVNILGLNADASNRFCAVGNDGRTGRIYHWTGSAWVEIQPHAPGFDRIWGEANSGLGDSASDTTGQIRLVCSTGGPGRVYLSRDYGETWTEARPLGDTGSYWQSVAVSRDGSVFMVGGINYLFISTDGVTWTRCRPGNPSYGQWMQMAIAQNGSVLYAASYDIFNGGVFRSTDGGATWTNVSPLVSRYRCVACDDTGQVVLAAIVGRIWLSTNGGTSWTVVASRTILPLSVFVSSDGQVMRYSTSTSGTYISRNQGATWTLLAQVAASAEDRIESNDDVSVIVVSNYDWSTETGYLVVSTDGGATWSERENPDGRLGRVYSVLGLSADGSRLLAGESWGRLYITTTTTPTGFGQIIMVEDGL